MPSVKCLELKLRYAVLRGHWGIELTLALKVMENNL